MIHLQAIGRKSKNTSETGFPFSVPTIASLQRLELESPVAFFVGENGAGKSTLLESLAAAANAVTIGGQDVSCDDSLGAARALAKHLRLEWRHRTHRGFFLRAEDFFPFARRLQSLRRELIEQADGYAAELEARPRDEGLSRARGSVLGQIGALDARYGENLDANSHGESFLAVFQNRFVPGGLYLLDEPEAALSPLRQLAFLSMLKEMVAQDCQFILATHSPILMAYPDAQIFAFEDGKIGQTAYEDVEHVRLTRAFLSDPQAFLHRL